MAKNKENVVDIKSLPFQTRAEMLSKEVEPLFEKYGVSIIATPMYQDRLAATTTPDK